MHPKRPFIFRCTFTFGSQTYDRVTVEDFLQFRSLGTPYGLDVVRQTADSDDACDVGWHMRGDDHLNIFNISDIGAVDRGAVDDYSIALPVIIIPVLRC